jgi:hypothetical protein
VSGLTLAMKRDPALQAGLLLGEPGSAAFAVRRKDVHLREALDDYLGSIRLSPSWSRLVVKYFGESALEVLGRARKG